MAFQDDKRPAGAKTTIMYTHTLLTNQDSAVPFQNELNEHNKQAHPFDGVEYNCMTVEEEEEEEEGLDSVCPCIFVLFAFYTYNNMLMDYMHCISFIVCLVCFFTNTPSEHIFLPLPHSPTDLYVVPCYSFS